MHMRYSTNLFQITGSLVSNVPAVGSYAELNHKFVGDDISMFARLSGDNNPIHFDEEIARKSIFGRPVVHGILTSSLFSAILGRTISGCVYVNQTLKFKRPAYVGEFIRARIEITKLDRTTKGLVLTCSTKCFGNDDKILIDGEAQVLLPGT